MSEDLSPEVQNQELESNDFSGGMTDNYFDSGPTRFKSGDNFFITIDRKLKERWGTVLFDDDNYILPDSPNRVDKFFTFINETKLLSNQGRNIYCLPDTDINPVWEAILGPTGNVAMSSGGPYNVITSGEYAHQLYLASDYQPIPSRVYKDENNEYQVRTVGLPRVQIQSDYNDVTLLQKAIVNANALRASIIAHILDADSVSPLVTTTNHIFQHANQDKYSLCYLQAVVFNPLDPEYPGPVPLPTPAPIATDLASLITLVAAMNTAYTHHNNDSGKTTFQIDYHFASKDYADGYLTFSPLAQLNNNVPPPSLYTAALMLDDLYQKFYWHQLALNLHGGGQTNDVTQMSRHLTVQSKIGSISYDPVNNIYLKTSPVVAPMYLALANYVDGLAVLYNGHAQGGGGFQVALDFPTQTVGANEAYTHIQPDTFNLCTLPQSTTLDSVYLKISWLRHLYNEQHAKETKALVYQKIKVDTTASSDVLSNVIDFTASTPVTLPVGNTVFIPELGQSYFSGPPGFENAAEVLVSSSGSANVSRLALSSFSAIRAGQGTAHFHAYFVPATDTTAVDLNTGTYNAPATEFLASPTDSYGTDMTTWTAYAVELMNALFTHIQDSQLHYINTGLPAYDVNQFNPTQTPLVPSWYVPNVSSLAYAFTYYYTYTVEPNGIEYINESNPVFSGSLETIEPFFTGYNVPTVNSTFYANTVNYDTYPIDISNIPVITNDQNTNYDVDNIKVRIYRTIDGGVTFFLLDTIDNGQTTYNDITNSTVPTPAQTLLPLNQTLYTSGGIVGNDQPPQAKCVHILSGLALYGNIIQSGQSLPNTLIQCIPNNPDSAPATFTDTLEDEIVSISSSRNNFIVLCTTSLYRVLPQFNILGQGAITHEKISDTVGCIGANSVVKTEIGVFFGGSDGFYYTDGFQIIKLSIDINKTYQKLIISKEQRSRMMGAYDKLNRRIVWSVQSQPTAFDCDMNFVFYIDYGLKPSGVFTSLSNNGQLIPAIGNPNHYNYWEPSAIIYYKGLFIRGDSRGLVFKQDDYNKTDPKIDLEVSGDEWNSVPIPFDYESTSMSLGSHKYRSWSTTVHFTGQNVGNAQVQIVANSDDGRETGNMAPINYTQNLIWGMPGIIWGEPTCEWYYSGAVLDWRRFPINTLRSSLRSIRLKNAYIGVYRSDDFPTGCTVTVNATPNTVVIATPAPFTDIVWPLDVVDYDISFENNGYINYWTVKTVVDDTITVWDPDNTLPNLTNQKWVLRGYKKNQAVQISNLTITFSPIGDKTTYWTTKADSGENTSG